MEQIIVENLAKRFDYFERSPQSLKSVLVNLCLGKKSFLSRKNLTVFEELNFAVEKGEFVGIMGANGVGKSTLLRLLSSIYIPTAGKIEVRGKLVSLIELGAGLHGDLSGLENIFLYGSILNMPKKQIEAKLPDIIKFGELEHYIHRPVKKYSSGMLARLGFSILAHVEADIYLLDEILSVGDQGFQKKSLAKIIELNRLGATILYVCHDPNHILNLCSRVLVIDRARLAYDGPPKGGVEYYLNLSGDKINA